MLADALLAPLVWLVAKILVVQRFFLYSDFMNRARILSCRFLGAQIGKGVTIRPGVLMKGVGNIRIGDNVFIGEQSCLVAYGGTIEIGDDTLIADQVYISTRNHRFRSACKTIRSQGYKGGDVWIGPDVWLAHGVVVLAGTRLSKGTVVGSALVAPKASKEYQAFTLAGEFLRESE